MLKPRLLLPVLMTITVSLVSKSESLAREAKKEYTKVTVGRVPLRTGGVPGLPAQQLLDGLDGSVLEDYEDVTLVEVNEKDKAKLKQRGDDAAVFVTLHDEFDKILLNGRSLDARGKQVPPGEKHDPPYKRNEYGTWILQFIGPVKDTWIESVKSEGIVPVQYVSNHAYIVGARESAIQAVDGLPFVQWTLQLHAFLKPSIGPREEEQVDLWIELAQTDETPDAVALLEELSEAGFEAAPWSDAELRVQGTFRTEDIDVILGQPLVIGIAERPRVELSDERAALALTDLQPVASNTGKYPKWLADLCPSCTNLQADGFYVGLADTGLDGGDAARNTDGTIPDEVPSSGLHRDEVSNSRVVYGQSFERTSYDSGQTWAYCGAYAICPDTTTSKHDTIGHGTQVATIAVGRPLPSSGKDDGGFFLGSGVAPSAGVVMTKINSGNIGSGARAVTDVTADALAYANKAYVQNFSLNQYNVFNPFSCDKFYDGDYSILSRDFDAAVLDANTVLPGPQPITLTVSSGNINQQQRNPASCPAVDRSLTLPPATAKNVIAIGGAENVRPNPWICQAAHAHSYSNLASNAKHGTSFAGWYKPDLIAVASNVALLRSNDRVPVGACASNSGFEPSLPAEYLAASGTSFAAPAAAGAATLASRRYSATRDHTPGDASPALLKAMLVAGTATMRGGSDRARTLVWKAATGNVVVGSSGAAHDAQWSLLRS